MGEGFRVAAMRDQIVAKLTRIALTLNPLRVNNSITRLPPSARPFIGKGILLEKKYLSLQ